MDLDFSSMNFLCDAIYDVTYEIVRRRDMNLNELPLSSLLHDIRKFKIQNFMQNCDETFFQAWKRFKAMLHDHPYHGFTHDELLEIFCKGLQKDMCEPLRGMGAIQIWSYIESLEPSEVHLQVEDVCFDPRELLVDVPWPSWKEDIPKLLEEQEAKSKAFEMRSQDRFRGIEASIADLQSMANSLHKGNPFELKISLNDLDLSSYAGLLEEDLPHAKEDDEVHIWEGHEEGLVSSTCIDDLHKELELSHLHNLCQDFLASHNKHHGEFSGNLGFKFFLYINDPFWQTYIEGQQCPNLIHISRLLQIIAINHEEMLGEILIAINAWKAKALKRRRMKEGNKELIEQLPPPLKIVDPPFEKGVLNPVV